MSLLVYLISKWQLCPITKSHKELSVVYFYYDENEKSYPL